LQTTVSPIADLSLVEIHHDHFGMVLR
jgi:hypothetical protein